MPEQTPRIGINKPLGTENVTRQAFNENWDIIDSEVAKQSDFSAHDANNTRHITAQERTTWNGKANGTHTHGASDLPTASTTQPGIVQLNDSTTSTSVTQAATPNAVKQVADSSATKADLASTATGKGASMVGVRDSSDVFTSTNVEGVLAELFSKLGMPVFQVEPTTAQFDRMPEGQIYRVGTINEPYFRTKVGGKKFEFDLRSLMTEIPSQYTTFTGDAYNAGSFVRPYTPVKGASGTLTLRESDILISYSIPSGAQGTSYASYIEFNNLDFAGASYIDVTWRRLSGTDVAGAYVEVRSDNGGSSAVLWGSATNLTGQYQTARLDIRNVMDWGSLRVGTSVGGTASGVRALELNISRITLV